MISAFQVSGISSLALITTILSVLQVLLGVWAVHVALAGTMLRKARVQMVIIGIAGFIVWAGFIIGPIMALISAGMPDRRFRLRGRTGRPPVRDVF